MKCNALSTSGISCKRRVENGGRCYQHILRQQVTDDLMRFKIYPYLEAKEIARLNMVSRNYAPKTDEMYWIKRLREKYPGETLKGDPSLPAIRRYDLTLRLLPLEHQTLRILNQLNMNGFMSFRNPSYYNLLRDILPHDLDFVERIKLIIGLLVVDEKTTQARLAETQLIQAAFISLETENLKKFIIMYYQPRLYLEFLDYILRRPDHLSLVEVFPLRKIDLVNAILQTSGTINMYNADSYRNLLDIYSTLHDDSVKKPYIGMRTDELLYKIILDEYPHLKKELLKPSKLYKKE